MDGLFVWGAAAALSLLLHACIASPEAGTTAAPPLTDLKWLAPSSDRVALLTTVWPDNLSGTDARGRGPLEVELGRIAFRSPALLGGVAARQGLSCQTCHPAGRANEAFFLAGLSESPGSVDTTTSVFSKKLGDGVFNPVRIPSLEGAVASAPYGHDGREPSLDAFIHMVAVDEFAGPAPSPRVLAAVLAYVSGIEPFPKGAARVPLTVASDCGELAREADVLDALLEGLDGEAADFVVFAMRHQIGRMHERFPGAKLADARAALEALSLSLREVRNLIDGARLDEAGAKLAAWRGRLQAARTTLAAGEEASLYNPVRLDAALRRHSVR